MPNLRQAMMAAAGAGGVGYLAYGWGANVNGSVGVGIDDVKYSSPIQILEDNWLKIAGGASFASGLKKNGTLWTWGRNDYGVLGHDDTLFRSAPAQVGSDSDWADTGDGKNHIMSIKTSGELWNTGRGTGGAVGDGTVINRSVPVQIGSLTDWSKAFDGGNSNCVCALKTDDTLWAWGINYAGKFGNDSVIYTSSPVQVGTGMAHAAFGMNHGHRIKTDGTLWATGDNGQGQLGIGTQSYTIQFSSPVQVGSLTDWSKVYSFTSFTMALKTDGTLWGWGRSSSGSLGDGSNINRSSPVQIGSLTDWSKLHVGPEQALAVKTDGTLWTWGENQNGSLGDGTVIDKSSPIQVGAETDWALPSNNYSSSWAIKSS